MSSTNIYDGIEQISETKGQLSRGAPASRWSRISITLVSPKTFRGTLLHKQETGWVFWWNSSLCKGRIAPLPDQSSPYLQICLFKGRITPLPDEFNPYLQRWNSSNSTISSTIKYRERQYRRGTNLALRVTQQVTFCWNYRTNSVHYHTYMGAGHTPYSVLRKVKLASLHY